MTEYDLNAGPDPAQVAASAPEQAGDDAAGTVHAVGIGPGNLAYLTPRARTAIEAADVLVGFETVVEFVAEITDATLLSCGYPDEGETLSTFAERVDAGDRGTAVLMGDPNHSGYQFLGKVEAAVERPVRVVPGISSIQLAASRARTPLEASAFVTLHRSGDLSPALDRLERAVGTRHLLILPRPYDRMPGDVARLLLDAGGSSALDALVCERLTHDEESITRTTLGALAKHAGGSGPDDTPFAALSVLVVRAD
jgi:cobalt-precorrin-7 (C5)-methyltransferase